MEVFVVSVVNYLVGLSTSNPKLVSVLAILYTVGLILKVLRTAIQTYVLQSPSKSDDAKLAELESSKAAKILFFVTDLLIRFKKL